MEETKLYGTLEETAEKEAIRAGGLLQSNREDGAPVVSWATEDEEEVEDALHNLPRKDGKVNAPTACSRQDSE